MDAARRRELAAQVRNGGGLGFVRSDDLHSAGKKAHVNNIPTWTTSTAAWYTLDTRGTRPTLACVDAAQQAHSMWGMEATPE